MSVGLSTLSQMQIAFFDSLNQFVTRYQQLIDGNASTEIAEVVGGARIRYIFHGFHDRRVPSRRVSLENGRIGLCSRDSRGRFPLLFPLLTHRNPPGHREPAGRERRFVHARSVLYQPHEERNPHLLPVLVVSLSNSIESSEDCTRLVEEELITDLQLVDLPIFTTCPLFKQRLFAVLQALITSFPRLVSPILGSRRRPWSWFVSF